MTQWKYLTSITSAVNPGTMEIEDIPFSAFRIIIHKSLIPPEKFCQKNQWYFLLWQVQGIVLSPLIFSVFHILNIFHSLWLIRMRKQPFPLKFPRNTLWVLLIWYNKRSQQQQKVWYHLGNLECIQEGCLLSSGLLREITALTAAGR